MGKEILLKVRDLTTVYHTTKGMVRAVNKLSFKVQKEESYGLVGESGCGKSTIALAIMGMLPEMAQVIEGEVFLGNKNLIPLDKKEMRRVWGEKLFMIFQDPNTSLNPLMKIMDQMGEAICRKEKRTVRRIETIEKGAELLMKVNILDPERVLTQFPHQLSGGMKQRIMIALGLCLHPDLLILDEPTTALDSTVQLKIIELLRSLKNEQKISQILITHDFGVASKLCDRIAVMYAGRIVEEGHYIDLLHHPFHPYTRGLFKCIIKLETKADLLETMQGFLPNLYNLPKGCYFQERCGLARPICLDMEPKLIELEKQHYVACHDYS